MLFHSSLRKELARSFGGTLVVLATIVMTIVLVRALGQASRGMINPSEVVIVVGFTVLGQMPSLLELSLFISIVATLSRMYTDSEMVIWFSSGRGLAGFLAPLYRFSWPILLAVAAVAMLIWPWTNQQIQSMKVRYEQRGDIDRVAPGQFQESANGSRVFFMDNGVNDKKSGSNIFISLRNEDGDSLITARTGRIDFIQDSRYLLLEHGQRLENSKTGGLDVKISDFESYGIRLPDDALKTKDEGPSKALSTLTLIQDPTRPHLGELAWRLGLSLSAINLVLIALAVSSVNPRVGRSGNLVFALLAFVVYNNLTSLGQSWIATGRMSLGGYLLTVHGGATLLGLAWLTWRHHNGSLRSVFQWRGVRRGSV